MATYYSRQSVGVKDGTNPAGRYDGRQVGARVRKIRADKVAGQAWAPADKIFIGTLRAGDSLREVRGYTDTSFATATISVGTLAVPGKYINAATLTAVNVPTPLGPLAAAATLEPLAAEEDLYITIGVAGVAGAVVAGFDLEIAGLN